MFRFTIRDMLLITLVAALGLGWWIDHENLVRSLESSHRRGLTEALSDVLRNQGCAIEMHKNAVVVVTPTGGQFAYRIPPAGSAN
jgi:hypothetical protein